MSIIIENGVLVVGGIRSDRRYIYQTNGSDRRYKEKAGQSLTTVVNFVKSSGPRSIHWRYQYGPISITFKTKAKPVTPPAPNGDDVGIGF